MPPDEATTLGSVERTGRVVLVDECHLRGSTASELAGTIAEKNVRFAESAAGRVCRADVPTPFSAVLDAAITPDVDKIVAAVRRVMG